jgi:3-dehydroquinate synthase
MALASALSVKKGRLAIREDHRIRELLQRLKLPTSMTCKPQHILDAVVKDKKRAGDRIHFILLEGVGQAMVEQISFEELEEALYA